MKRLLLFLLLPTGVQAQDIQETVWVKTGDGGGYSSTVVTTPRDLADKCIPLAMRNAKGRPTKEGRIYADSLVKAYKTFYKLARSIQDTSTIKPLGFHYEGDDYRAEVYETYERFLRKGGACDVKLFPTIEDFLALEQRYRDRFASRERQFQERQAGRGTQREIDNAQMAVKIKRDLAILAKAEYLFRQRNGVFTRNALLLRPFITEPLQSTQDGEPIITIETSFDYNEQVTIVIQVGPVRCGADVLPNGEYRTSCL